VDRQSPSISGFIPSLDALNVAPGTPVEIVFSEPMERQRTEEAVFVTPETKLGFAWKGRRLRLQLEGGLRPDRTYVVTVGTGARDLRGNALEASFTLAFSTGERLNQERIKGVVYYDHQPVAAAHVWAYDLARGDAGSLKRPSYRTQSGRDGAYEFSRLAAGQYRLLAFIDENRNQEYDPSERLALAAADVVIREDEEALAGDLALASRQGIGTRLKRVQAVHSRRLLLHFTQAVEASQVTVRLKDLAVEEVYGNPQDSTKVYVRTEPQEAGREYRLATLQISGASVKWDEVWRGSGRQDRTAPQLTARYPDGGLLAATDSLKLFFDESMARTIPDGWLNPSDSLLLSGGLNQPPDVVPQLEAIQPLAVPVPLSDAPLPATQPPDTQTPDTQRPDVSTQLPTGRWQWSTAATLVFVADKPYPPGAYRLAFSADFLQDQAGLGLTDSSVVFEFEVPKASARIAGRVKGSGSEVAWIVAQNIAGRSYRSRVEAAGDYNIDGLLPGEYVLFAFADLDGDGKQGFGQRQPWLGAEPYTRRPENVVVKAGETQDGIDLELR